MGPIEKQSRHLVQTHFPEFLDQPASLSGRFHLGETMGEHMDECVRIIGVLAVGMGVKLKAEIDLLCAAAYLHDVGKALISAKGNVKEKGWRYFKTTGWSRRDDFMCIHPTLSAAVLDRFDNLERKEELKKLVSIHMGHWYKRTPKPSELYEYLLVLADYLSCTCDFRSIPKVEDIIK